MFRIKLITTIILIMLCSSLLNAQALSGNYTIGGTSPDFPTLSGAVASLNTNGVSGPVVFNIRSGTYSERITIGQVTGASPTNTITFKSEKGHSDSVIVTYTAAAAADRPTVLLNGTDYVVLRDMTINTTGASFGACIWLTNSADSNTFTQLKLNAGTTQTGTNLSVIVLSGTSTAYSAGTSGSYNTFSHLVVNGGYYGIYARGANTTNDYETNNRIINSTFTQQYYYAIYAYSQTYPEITGNTITQLRRDPHYGIYLNYTSNITVTTNTITIGSIGIYCGYTNTVLHNSGFASTIVNNMVRSGNNLALNILAGSNRIKVYHNTFKGNIAGNGTVSLASGVGFLDIQNNIIANDNPNETGYTLYSAVTNTCDSLDGNSYMSEWSGVYFGALYKSLDSLKSKFPLYNANSYYSITGFVSAENLHLSGKGFAPRVKYIGVDKDIDGNTRGTTYTTVGADEGVVLMANDAAVSGFAVATKLFCPAGPQTDVKIYVSNAGNNTLSNVVLNWEVEGVLQTPVNVGTALSAGGTSSTLLVSLGSISFTAGDSKTIKVWTSAPNGTSDPQSQNDTMQTVFSSRLSGTYTIGGSSPSFTSFSQAITALVNQGVCGPVVFDVRPGTYNERVVIPDIVGVSDINTITFKGAGTTATTLTYASTDANNWATLLINGTDYLRFRDMAIVNTGTGYGAGVWLTNRAINFILKNVKITVDTTTTSQNIAGFVLSGTATAMANGYTYCDFTNIDSVEIIGGYYGINYVSGSGLNGHANNSTISNSKISGYVAGGIYAVGHNYISLLGNHIQTLRSGSFAFGVLVSYAANINVSNNRIYTKGAYGLTLDYVNLVNANATYSSRITNNMISCYGGSAVRFTSAYTLSFLHNSLRSDSTSVATIVIEDNNSALDFRNNHIQLDDTAKTVHLVKTGINGTAYFINFDNNNYFTAGGFIRLNSTSYADLAAVKTAFNTLNIKSLAVNPSFAGFNDLTPKSRAAALYGAYMPLVDTDIRGMARNKKYPSIGAYESAFSLSDNASVYELSEPIGLFCDTTAKNVKVVVTNMGNTVINSGEVQWSVNGAAQTPVTITTPIDTFGGAGSNTATIQLASLNFAAGTLYKLKVWTAMPNGNVDSNPADDTLQTIVGQGLNGVYTVGGNTADFENISVAVKALENNGMCGPVKMLINAGIYNEKLVLGAIGGLSSVNTLEFAGAGRNKTIVSDSLKGTVFYISGTQYLTLRDMTIHSMGIPVELNNPAGTKSDFNKFINLAVMSDSIGATDNYGNWNVVGIKVNNSSMNLFDSLSISGGNMGIALIGNGAGNTISNSHFTEQYHHSISISELWGNGGGTQNSLVIDKNYFNSYRSVGGASPGLSQYVTILIRNNATDIRISNNRIHSGQNGIYPYQNSVSGDIYNNIIDTRFLGLSTYGLNNNTKVYHNTFYNPSSTALSFNLYTFGNSKVDFRNNHLITTQTASSPVYVYSFAANFTYFDYNHFSYANGAIITKGYYNDASDMFATLANFKAYYPQFNQNSLENTTSFDANLYAAVDLPGTYVGINFDIDGKPRCKTRPAIGATEITDYTLKQKLTAHVSADSVFVNTPVTFSTNFANITNQQFDYKWYLDGVQVATTKEFVKPFTATGTHTIKVVASNCMNADSALLNIQVYNPTSGPKADFYAHKTVISKYYTEELQLFDISAHGPDEWTWTITPANTVTLFDDKAQNPKAIFLGNPGYYDVCLIAKNSLGADTICKEKYITVLDSQVMCAASGSSSPAGVLYDNGGNGNYSHSKYCGFLINPCTENLSLKFNKLALADKNDVLNIYDGANNSGILIGSFAYGQGSGLPVLTANSGSAYIEWKSDNAGADQGFELEWMAAKNTPVVADFAIPAIVYTGEEAIFTSTAGSSKHTLQWDMETTPGLQGGTQTEQYYTWSDTGLYEIKLIVSGCDGDIDSITKTIHVVTPSLAPVAGFYASKTRVKAGLPVILTDTSANGVTNRKWEVTPAASLSAPATKQTEVLFTTPGTYTVKLVVSNALGADSIEKVAHIDVFEYCEPAVNQLNSDIGISKVSYAGINHTSPVGQARYTDYSNVLTAPKVILNSMLQITVERNTTDNAMSRKAWIDWNQDGDFNDSLELVAYEAPAKTASFKSSVTIPVFAKQGFTLIRIGTAFGNGTNADCGINAMGEFEDYPIEIVLPQMQSPVIVLRGLATDSVPVFASYTDSAANATDYFGSDITTSITTSGTVNTNVVGTYTLSYEAVDAWQNKTTVARTVVVYDAVAPVITLTGNDTLFVEVFTAINDLGATATDNYYSATTIVTDSSAVNNAKTGLYVITYTVTDSSSNTANKVRYVKIVDTTIPVITLNGNDTLELEVNAAYIEQGATLTDNYCVNNWQVSSIPNMSVLGEYILTYTATDCEGNIAIQKQRVVKVVDKTAPVITLNGSDLVMLARWQNYTDAGYTVSDNYYDSVQISIDTLSNWVNASVEGLYYIQYRATDLSGNTSLSAKRIIDVRGTNSVGDVHGNTVTLYPNPNNGQFELSGLERFANGKITVTSVLGAKVLEDFITATKQSIQLQNVAAGIYMVILENNGQRQTIKVTVQ
jgi:PKD repeat protein